MPLYNLFCNNCKKLYKKLLKPEQLLTIECVDCKIVLVREAIPPDTSIYEVLDNGIMAKRLERLQNTDELYKNRNKKEE